MPLRKLGGKFHFFLRFCTRKRSKTYALVGCTKTPSNSTITGRKYLYFCDILHVKQFVIKNARIGGEFEIASNSTRMSPNKKFQIFKRIVSSAWKCAVSIPQFSARTSITATCSTCSFYIKAYLHCRTRTGIPIQVQIYLCQKWVQ